MASRASTIERDGDALFVKDGVPVKFCFHRSVTQGRGQITRDVERHGGKIVPDERHANVLLVDEQEDLNFFRRRYYSSTELYRLSLYIEPRGFVQRCVRSGTYVHVGPVQQGMPGRAPGGGGRERVPFTEEDRDHLAYYLATRCPKRDGRMGNNAYKDLERLGRTDDPSWAWAGRHTFHSWREHYKMNSVMMDARIACYVEQLRDVGHHFGHDPRRHDRWELRQEEEESDDDEEGEQWQGIRRESSERREQQQVRPAVAVRQARDYLARHERDLVTLDEDDSAEEQAIQEPRRAKRVRRGAHPQRDVLEPQRKRLRQAFLDERRAPNAEPGRDKSVSARRGESDSEASQEIEGSDLFGDRAYGDEPPIEFDDSREVDFPIPFSPRASSIREPDGAPLSTQATLVASPVTARTEKEPNLAPGPTLAKMVDDQEPGPEPTAPPSAQQTVVMTQERAVVQRARVRGASAQPGPSVSKEARTRGGVAAAEGPYRNTRARSRSAEPQPYPQPKQRQEQRIREKAKEEVLALIEEDIQVEEPGRSEVDADELVVVTGGLSVRETPEDEMAVEGLLQASVGSAVGEGAGSDDGDGDEDLMSELPRFQEVEVESDPMDSDDAETHGSLVRGAVRERTASKGGGDAPSEDRDEDSNMAVWDGSVDAGESKPHQIQGQDEKSDSDDADADRIERMARGSLQAVLAPTPLGPGVTRSMVATQSQAQTGTRISPRQTRSGRARVPPPGFPSPGTKARAVVDRFQEEERRMPYQPPAGSRAARAVGERRKGG